MFLRKLTALVVWCCLCPVVAQATTTHQQRVEEAWRRVYAVESSCGRDPDAYIENHCRALGVVQITPVVVDDVNRILKCPAFGLNDRLDLEASREMFKVTMKHYYPNGTVENMCRLWYRGSNRKKQADKHGDSYWADCVRKAGMR